MQRIFFHHGIRSYAGTVAICAVALMSTPSQSRGDITIDRWGLATETSVEFTEGPPLFDFVSQSTPSSPFSLTHTATALAGVSVGSSTYDFSTSGGATTFSFSFDHLASGLSFSQTLSEGSLSFTPDTDMPYSLSANYGLTGNGLISMGLWLADENGTQFENSVQESEGVANQAFTFPEAVGLLEAGTEYTFRYDFHIDGTGAGNVAGAGGLNFIIGNIEAVPAPGALVLAVIGLGFVCAKKRRRE